MGLLGFDEPLQTWFDFFRIKNDQTNTANITLGISQGGDFSSII